MNKSQIVGIVTCAISCIGTAATAYFASKDSKKEVPNDEHKIKNHFKKYWRTYVAGGITITSNLVGTTTSYKSIGALTLTVAGLSANIRDYKKEVNELLSEKQKELLAQKQIESQQKKIEYKSDRKLYYNEYTGLFAARPEDVAMAYKKMNDILNHPYESCRIMIKDFLEWCHAELADPYEFKPYENFGWDVDIMEELFQTSFIHIVEEEDSMELSKLDDNGEPVSLVASVLKFNEEATYLGD